MDAPARDPSPSPPRPRSAPVRALLDAYGSLSVSVLLAPLTDEFVHQVLPASLGMPARDKAGFAQHAAGVFALFDDFAMEPQAVHEDARAGTVVVHALMRGTLRRGAAQVWRNECVLLVHLTPDGAAIARIDEFVDSAKALEMRKRYAPREFAPASPSGSLFSSAVAAVAGWLAPTAARDGLVPYVVASTAQVVAVCVAYQTLTRSYSRFLKSEP